MFVCMYVCMYFFCMFGGGIIVTGSGAHACACVARSDYGSRKWSCFFFVPPLFLGEAAIGAMNCVVLLGPCLVAGLWTDWLLTLCCVFLAMPPKAERVRLPFSVVVVWLQSVR